MLFECGYKAWNSSMLQCESHPAKYPGLAPHTLAYTTLEYSLLQT